MTLVPGSRLDFPFEVDLRGPAEPPPDALVYVFRADRRLLVWKEGETARVPTAGELRSLEVRHGSPIRLGLLDGVPAYVAALEETARESTDASSPAAMTFGDLRQLSMRLDEPTFWVGARAVQILEWDRDTASAGGAADRPRTTQSIEPRSVPRASCTSTRGWLRR